MIKASSRTPLGLSGENLTRLAAGEPIHVRAKDTAELGLPAVEVVIVYGRTEQDILDDVKKHGIRLNLIADAAQEG